MVTIDSVKHASLSESVGIKKDDVLISINGHTIDDVLDYRFYLAEEEHQKYSLKNPDEFLNEEIISGRKDYKWIKLN